ncbi:unnamed protein product [Cuscuta europaea]|uniref:Uncharacterized protein n=1 Tax=Cuscuta europaea TaxID=41803 RepID=A0A9P0YTS0_CUSEU|nr:unnamed protein product [Cuscuta europaea]
MLGLMSDQEWWEEEHEWTRRAGERARRAGERARCAGEAARSAGERAGRRGERGHDISVGRSIVVIRDHNGTPRRRIITNGIFIEDSRGQHHGEHLEDYEIGREWNEQLRVVELPTYDDTFTSHGRSWWNLCTAREADVSV